MEKSAKLQPAASAVGSLDSEVSAIGRKPSGERRANAAKPEGSRPAATKTQTPRQAGSARSLTH